MSDTTCIATAILQHPHLHSETEVMLSREIERLVAWQNGVEETINEISQMSITLRSRIAILEERLCVAHDYLMQHWDMDSAPLNLIKETVEQILANDQKNVG